MELGGDAVNGVTTNTSFFPGDPAPEVQHFVHGFEAKYHQQPDAFNAFAYDAVIIAAYALRSGGTDRRAVRDALVKLHDVPSVIFGKATFNPETRRVIGVKSVNLVVVNGQWALLQSKPALAAK
jgi:branched-chain amino acid transport system substrate-binding protein